MGRSARVQRTPAFSRTLTCHQRNPRLTSHMPRIYSTYEAKARLSELLAHVRKGDAVTITHRGEPIAEVWPVEKAEPSLAARIDDLRKKGNIARKGERRP